VPALDDGVDVERGAADEERDVGASQHPIDSGVGEILIASQRHFALRWQDVDQVMGYALPLDGIRLSHPDVEAAVEIACVGVDDFAAKLLRQ
jgi:hypothetical protein